MANKIQLRRDTSINWNVVNPVLSDGEPGLETDTNKVKYGDGSTPWQALPYASGGSGGGGDRLTNGDHSLVLDSSGHLTLPNDGSDISVIVTDNFQIQTGAGTKTWSFGNNGRLTLPDGWQISNIYGSSIFAAVATSGSYNDLTDKPTSANTANTAFDGNNIYNSAANDLTLTAAYNSGTGNSYITLPSNSNSSSNPVVITNNNNGGVNIVTKNNATWNFDKDGTLIAPGHVIIPTGDGSLGLMFSPDSGTSNNGYISVDAGANMLASTTSGFSVKVSSDDRIVLTHQDSTLIAGNDLYLKSNKNSSEKIWKFDTAGNLTIPGEIHSTAGTGPVSIQSNDGSNNFVWDFKSNGSLKLPSLIGAQGNGNFDATNNAYTLSVGGQVDFNNFSGMILVNSHNGGNVSLYLCGGGMGDAVAIGSSKGSALGTMSFNSFINGYSFLASEAGDYVFVVIRTRTGA